MGLDRIRLTGPARWLILLIAAHSLILGCLMLFIPNLMLLACGFEQQTPPFFPAQTGLFLMILGACYLASLRMPQLILVILISKAAALAFLVTFGLLLGGPLSIWLAAVGDGAMLAAVISALRFGERAGFAKSP